MSAFRLSSKWRMTWASLGSAWQTRIPPGKLTRRPSLAVLKDVSRPTTSLSCRRRTLKCFSAKMALARSTRSTFLSRSNRSSRKSRGILENAPTGKFRVLGLTFTNKAAAEMRDRLDKLAPRARERALLTTFHSFAADILRQHGSHIGLRPDYTILNQDADREGVFQDAI